MNVSLPFFLDKLEVLVFSILGDYICVIMAVEEFEGLRLFTMLRSASCCSALGIDLFGLGRNPANFRSIMYADY